MTDPLTGHRNIDDAAPRDLTRQEVEALMAHRVLGAWCQRQAALFSVMHDANDALQLGVVTSPAEISAWLADYARTIEAECGRIERGVHGPEEV